MLKINLKKLLVNSTVVLIIFLVDRFSKIYILKIAALENKVDIYISEYLNLYLIWNKGIAFGLFSFEENLIYNLISLTIFVTVLALSFAISIKLQSIISEPILNLANTTNRLSQEHDYSLRVTHNADDEIGTLYAGFNEMLLQIDKRDIELGKYKTDLENKVRTRTSELSKVNKELSSYNEKLNQEIQEREKVEEDLKSSLDEKDILLGEIHHRVKNNLQIISSLLRLQSNHTSNTESKEIFSECSQRIESMALLYEKIYGSINLSEIELEEYFADLVSGLLVAYGIKNKSISIAINTHSISLDIDSIVPCSLIMQELISNSLKHAFPNGSKGKIDVSLRRINSKRDSVELKVADNGIGLSAGWDLYRTETLGLQLVKRLSEGQLKGSISVDKKEGAGFTIVFPFKEGPYGTIEV